jgi:hypothetical protein
MRLPAVVRHLSSLCLLLCLLLLPQAARAATKPSQPRVFVVPLAGAAGVRFDMGVVRFVAAPLSHHVRPVPLQIARLAYHKSHVTPNGAKKKYSNAQKLGRAAGATYVLLIEAVGKAPKQMAHTVLIEVKTARAVQSNFFVLPAGRWNAAVGQQVVASLLPRLSGKAAVDALASHKQKALAPNAALGGSVDPTDPDAAYNPAEMDETDRRVHRRARGPRSRQDDRWRSGLRLTLAPLFLQRTGTITPKVANPNIISPCYCGTARDANPYFVGGLLGVEVYPLSLLKNGDSLWEGLGVHLEAAVSGPETIVDPNKQTTIRSVMVDFKVGAQFRYVLWDSPLATDLQVDGGLTMYNFPLRSGGFPGVAYKAGYLGLSAHAPLGMPELVLLAGAHVLMGVKTGDTAATWLGTQQGGTGFNLHTGLRYQIGHFEVGGQYRLEVYSTRFSGPTRFPDSAVASGQSGSVQLSDVTLRDSLNEFTLTGSFTY